MNIGVLSIQGDFTQFKEALSCFNVNFTDVREPRDLNNIDGLILPGGESTAIGIVAQRHGMLEPLREFVRSGRYPVWGICAGVIMLSDRVTGLATDQEHKEYQPLIGGLGVRTNRNHFGSQMYSSIKHMDLSTAAKKAGLASTAHFIRAPAIQSYQDGVEVLAAVKKEKVITAVRQSHILGTVFHTELSNDLSWVKYFLHMVSEYSQKSFQQTRQSRLAEIPAANNSFESLTSVKRAMPRFLQGGVIMDVVNAEQAKIAEKSGACAVMALERIPADIRADGGVSRMSDPLLINGVIDAVTIPVMAKARIGHFGEARLLEALEVDCIDESEVLTCADTLNHIRKERFKVPFVCGAEDLGSALRRIGEGASMIRLKGNAGTGDVKNAVMHARKCFGAIRRLQAMSEDEVFVYAKEIQAPLHLVRETRRLGRLPVVTFAAGGIATPADVILMMEMGCDGVFVGSGIFKSSHPAERARAIVDACTYWKDAKKVAKISEGLGKAMVGILLPGEKYALVAPSSPAASTALSRSGDQPAPYQGLDSNLKARL